MNQIEDSTAIHILKTLAARQLKPSSGEPAFTAGLITELATTFNRNPDLTPSEGDLARAALALLSEDPLFAEPIRLMAAHATSGQPEKYIEPATIALTTAVLLALQTRIKFKAELGPKCHIEIEKKSLGDATLKLVVQRLLAYLDPTNPKP